MTNSRGFMLVVGLATILGIGVTVLGVRSWQRSEKRGARADSIVSVFEPHAGGCVWIAVTLPKAESRRVATYRKDCGGARVVWNTDGTRALVWFGEDADSTVLYLTDTRPDGPVANTVELPLPSTGELVTLAFARDGQPLAFTLDNDARTQRSSNGADVFLDGETEIPALSGSDGADVLARAYRLKAGGEDLTSTAPRAWQTTETRASKCCTDDAPGVATLGTWQAIVGGGPALSRDRVASAEQLTPIASWPELREENLLARLSSFAPPEVDEDPEKWGGAWGIIATDINDSGPRPPSSRGLPVIPRESMFNLAFWALRNEFGSVSGHMVAVNRLTGEPQKLERWWFNISDLVHLQFSGPTSSGRWLLIADAWVGTRPLVYDLVLGHVAYSTEVGHGAVFWP